MRRELKDPVRLAPERSRSATRRRRLSRGVDRWLLDTRHGSFVRDQLRAEKADAAVWLLLFTTAGDMADVLGRIRHFWQVYRTRCGRAPYFAWLELTAEGRPHYHAMLVDPPLLDDAETKAWIEATWGAGFVKIRRRPLRWLSEGAGAYVGNYAKKIGDKRYQQVYDDVPRQLRTFVCNRLESTVARLDAHLPSWEVVCTAPPDASWYVREVEVWLLARLEHPSGAGCTLRLDRKSQTRRTARARRTRRFEDRSPNTSENPLGGLNFRDRHREGSAKARPV